MNIFRTLWLVLLLAALIAGCGSDTSSVPTASGPPGPTNQVYNGFILGRVKLDRQTSEGPVEILGLDGTVIHRLQTDKLGWFKARGTLPVDFRVRAQRGADTYLCEYRGGWPGGTLYVNAATTLASAYLQTHPGMSLDDAEAIIHRYLKLPARFKLSWVSTINCSTFHTATFMANVRRAGLAAYLDALLHDVDNPLRLLGLVEAGAKILGTAASGLFSTTVNDAVGSGVSKMGFNFTTSGALSQIQDQLSAVSAQISALSQQFSTAAAAAELQAILAPLQTNAESINITSTNISQAAAAFQATHAETASGSAIAYNSPSTYPALASTTSQLQNLDLQNNLQPIVNSLIQTDSGGLYQALVNKQMTLLKLEADTSWNGYPWRYNALTSQQAALFGGFITTIGQGGELACEYANLQTNLAPALLEAANQTSTLAMNIQQAAQQVPDLLPSDELILDLSNQVMWVNSFYAQDSYANATDTAANLTIGPYDDFVLPSEQMLNSLIIDRVIQNANPPMNGSNWGDSTVNSTTGNTSWPPAFANIGFDVSNYNYANLPGGDGAHENDEGGYFQASGGCIYWWNGTGSNPSTQTDSDADGWTTSYLICRQFPGQPEAAAVQENSTLVALSDAQSDSSPFSAGSVFVGSVRSPEVSIANTTTSGIQLKATQAFGTGFYEPEFIWGSIYWDITYRAYWTSSNTTAATVSNFAPPELAVNTTYPPPPYPKPGPAGWVVWHPSLTGAALPPVTITASYFGVADAYGTTTQVVNGTIVLQPPSGLVPILNQVNVLPVNQVYNVATNSSITVPCSLTAFYADGQIQDVSADPNTTWTLTDADGNILSSSSIGGFGVQSGSAKNELLLTDQINTTNVTISATYAGQWGTQSSTGVLGLILPNQGPTISKILPTRGSVAGGTNIIITGTNLGSTTSVTIGGVQAQFFVSTNTQISVTTPPGAAAGSVPVVVTNSHGSSQGQVANFDYTSP